MLYLSLTLSALLLTLANVAALRRSRPWSNAFLALGCVVSFLTPCLMFFLPPVATLYLALAPLLFAWIYWGLRPAWFVAVSFLAAALVFGYFGRVAWTTQKEYARLRDLYPYESMESRLPTPNPAFRLATLPDAVALQLQSIEESDGLHRSRGYYLQQLHERTTDLFINSPGFGVARMGRPTEESIRSDLPPDEPIPQPQPRLSSGAFLDEVAWAFRPPSTELAATHWKGVLDFADAEGFGLFKDRRRVAGFQPHRMTKVPELAAPWALRSVDLVSLLLHDKPAVYVSENLPSMKEVRHAPTRPPDAFESAGLERLRKGEDLVFGTHGERGRMLGAIRNVKQCVACHGGERGDLLGAFSYNLERKTP